MALVRHLKCRPLSRDDVYGDVPANIRVSEGRLHACIPNERRYNILESYYFLLPSPKLAAVCGDEYNAAPLRQMRDYEFRAR